MNIKNAKTVEALHTHTHTHTDNLLINKKRGEANG